MSDTLIPTIIVRGVDRSQLEIIRDKFPSARVLWYKKSLPIPPYETFQQFPPKETPDFTIPTVPFEIPTTGQGIYMLQKELSEAMGIPLDMIHVQTPSERKLVIEVGKTPTPIPEPSPLPPKPTPSSEELEIPEYEEFFTWPEKFPWWILGFIAVGGCIYTLWKIGEKQEVQELPKA